MDHTATLLVLVLFLLVRIASLLESDYKHCLFRGAQILFYGLSILYLMNISIRSFYSSYGIAIAIFVDMLSFLLVIRCWLNQIDNNGE